MDKNCFAWKLGVIILAILFAIAFFESRYYENEVAELNTKLEEAQEQADFAYEEGCDAANSERYYEGYSDGYDDGYSDGYGNFEEERQEIYGEGEDFGYTSGYQKGYVDGYYAVRRDDYDIGYNDGYNAGYKDCYGDQIIANAVAPEKGDSNG